MVKKQLLFVEDCDGLDIVKISELWDSTHDLQAVKNAYQDMTGKNPDGKVSLSDEYMTIGTNLNLEWENFNRHIA